MHEVSIREFVNGLSDTGLTELGNAISALEETRFARVIVPLVQSTHIPAGARYHLDTAIRHTLGHLHPEMTNGELIERERQMMG